MDIKDFNHKITVTVRFNEVDMLGVCNNAVYINFFEDARLQYMKQLGIVAEDGKFTDGDLYFMVRNVINYQSHAFYDEELNIWSKISYIGKSSFGFTHLVENVTQGRVIADGEGVVVHVDPETRKSKPHKREFFDKVQQFEKDVQIKK